MGRMPAEEFGSRIGTGLLSFPVTHFTERYDFDEEPYREHLEWLLQHHPAALFAAGGTGEFFSLTLREFSSVVSCAVEQTGGACR
jgi:5-dehydro-4-deoxyglucarate dehydratase